MAIVRRLEEASDSLGAFLVAREIQRLRIAESEREEMAQLVGPRAEYRQRPDTAYVYFWLLGSAWRSFIFPLALLALACAFLGRETGGAGLRVGFAIGVAPAIFCLLGSFDALWRYPFARWAHDRFVSNELEPTAQSRELMRIATVNDGTLLLQLVGAALVSWRIAA